MSTIQQQQPKPSTPQQQPKPTPPPKPTPTQQPIATPHQQWPKSTRSAVVKPTTPAVQHQPTAPPPQHQSMQSAASACELPKASPIPCQQQSTPTKSTTGMLSQPDSTLLQRHHGIRTYPLKLWDSSFTLPLYLLNRSQYIQKVQSSSAWWRW